MTGISAPVLALQHDQRIHIGPHEVFRGTQFVHVVTCDEADVLVDRAIPVEGVVVICWWDCPRPGKDEVHGPGCGAVVYDANDCVERRVA